MTSLLNLTNRTKDKPKANDPITPMYVALFDRALLEVSSNACTIFISFISRNFSNGVLPLWSVRLQFAPLSSKYSKRSTRSFLTRCNAASSFYCSGLSIKPFTQF